MDTGLQTSIRSTILIVLVKIPMSLLFIFLIYQFLSNTCDKISFWGCWFISFSLESSVWDLYTLILCCNSFLKNCPFLQLFILIIFIYNNFFVVLKSVLFGTKVASFLCVRLFMISLYQHFIFNFLWHYT